jgi:BirA family biotin operon repressor/biotin-[acetyl-CoA-carboxylase] ligase
VVLHLSTVDSTSSVAKALLENYEAVIVSADYQTGGRGRNGKSWVGDPGANVYISFGYRHAQPVTQAYLLSAMAFPTLAVIDVVREHIPTKSIRIKYPNDIQVNTDHGWAKISGILVEHEFEGARCVATTIGIGLNVGQKTFPDTINQPCTSINLQGSNVSSAKIREQLVQRMVEYAGMHPGIVNDRWNKELGVVGKLVYLQGDSDTWIVEQILPDGRLLVRSSISHQERTVDNGDSIRYFD